MALLVVSRLCSAGWVAGRLGRRSERRRNCFRRVERVITCSPHGAKRNACARGEADPGLRFAPSGLRLLLADDEGSHLVARMERSGMRGVPGEADYACMLQG